MDLSLRNLHLDRIRSDQSDRSIRSVDLGDITRDDTAVVQARLAELSSGAVS